jgi:phosphatidylinositol glycan class H protein
MRGFLQRLSAPPAQILQTLQPTPFTVSYAVSTRPVPKTVFAQVTSYVSLLTRIIVGLSTTLLIWTVSGFQTAATEYYLLSTLGRLRTDQLLVLAGTCEWKYVVPGALVILLLVFRRNYTGTFIPCIYINCDSFLTIV